MQRLSWPGLVLSLLALPALGAERFIDFSTCREGQTPPGFRSAVTGQGTAGDWKIVLDEVPPLLAPLTPQAASHTMRPVLAQLAQDPTDEHFPLLIDDEDSYKDFTLTTRFKTVKGAHERMAGIAFRLQDEKNYYVVRASSLGNTFRFYKVVNGQRGVILGPDMPIPSGVWHELTLTCQGNQIRCQMDGKDVTPPGLTDSTFVSGKIAFWTKSDSVSYFGDTRIVYTPLQAPALALVRQIAKKYPRLLGLKVYVPGKEPLSTRVIASENETELGHPGSKTELAVLGKGETYYGREKDTVSVIMPLRDRNGDPIAVVRIVMKSFPGQTEENAIIRAAPIVKQMQAQVHSMQDLTE